MKDDGLHKQYYRDLSIAEVKWIGEGPNGHRVCQPFVYTLRTLMVMQNESMKDCQVEQTETHKNNNMPMYRSCGDEEIEYGDCINLYLETV